MPFEHYKTQVLLLHSQQTTLDKLRSGFTDQYTVHCATNGTEALNTLGETPIHVIVTAQDLPGMSGLDALREARKRSPDTIAILLAGTDSADGLEAMVGDKEVFQIVRGEIAPDTLKDLIDSATKSVRLLALSEASNDKAANVDEPYPTGEHIVMETAENGSVIISDGTGTVPVLRPDKIQVAANAGGQSVDVLVLTKDEEFLNTVRESSRGMHNVHHAVTPNQAEEITAKHSVGILVTDAAMVGSNIEALSQRLRSSAPRLVAIVAGRRDDGELLMDLINRGHVYRFLLKPVSPGRARLAIEASVKHHLEAADSAFTGKPRGGSAAPVKPAPAPQAAAPARPAAAPPQKPPVNKPAAAPTPAARAAAKKSAAPAPQARAAKAKPQSSAAPGDIRREPTLTARSKTTATNDVSPLSGNLDDAFEETNSFTETMTGIAVSFGKSIAGAAESLKNKKKDKQKKKAEKEQQAARTSDASRVGPELAPPPGPVSTPVPEAATKPAPAAKAPAPQKTPAPAAAPPPVATAIRPTRPAAATLSDDGGESLLSNPKVIALIAGVVLFSVLSWWMFSGDDDIPRDTAPMQTAAPAPTDEMEAPALPVPVAEDPAPVPAATGGADIDALLADVRDARNRGDIYAPAGQNAVELLLAAQNAAPTDDAIATEMEALIQDVFGMAETALLENRATDASRALRVIGLADPDNPRLAFLNAQLGQQQLRGFLDDARVAIRENRFEDAGRLLERAESTAGGSTAEIGALSSELASARSSQRIDDVLALAGQRLQEDRLIAPPNDNARYYYQLAQTNAPGNIAAEQGLVAVASKLVLRARTAIDDAEYDTASRLLDDARSLDPRSAELSAAVDALNNARNQQTNQARVAEEQRLEAERLAGERAAIAEREAAAERLAAERAEAERLAAERQAAADAAAQAEAESRPAVAAASVAAEPPAPVAISTLERTVYVPPRYPRLAQRRNTSGHVDLAFTVTAEGKVTDVEVTDSEPGTMFDDAAVEAVEQWEFEPPVENGVAIEKRVAVRMSFALQ